MKIQANLARKDWLYGFLSRNPDLSLRKPEAKSLSRGTSFNKIQAKIFYRKLQEILLQNDVSHSRIFNTDKTGISNVQKPGKFLGERRMNQVGKLKFGKRENNYSVLCNEFNWELCTFNIYISQENNVTNSTQ